MLKEVSLSKIKQIEKEQEEFQNKIPYEVKYVDNFLWQIYYSDISHQFFMLVPMNEKNNAAFFYLLKKQIESYKTKKDQYIYVPVSHLEYSGRYLTKSQIADMENYLWYFTKQWPSTFEVYDKENKMKLKVIGKTNVYETMKSTYAFTFETKEQALEQYKLFKALFILSTALEEYKFQSQINQKGELDFYLKGSQKLEYKTMTQFLTQQATIKIEQIEEIYLQSLQEKAKLEALQQETEKQTQDYLEKQRQIATFLACKKSFFKRVKYYFGTTKAKKKVQPNEPNKPMQQEIVQVKMQENSLAKKEQYTIEDLIEIGTTQEQKAKELRSLELDVKALELKKENNSRKIKNANIYLNEIELHKKSIFEFWKFTTKDELPSLEEGEEQVSQKEKIEKAFVFEEDFEELGIRMDQLQRRKLSKNETDSIFGAMQALTSMQILNETKSNELTKEQLKALEKEFKKIQKEYVESNSILEQKDYDIFGAMLEDKTKLKEINHIKHREIEKDKFKVLNVTTETELTLYLDNLRNHLKLLKEAYHKITTDSNFPMYFASTQNLQTDNLNIFNLNLTNEMEEVFKNKRANQKIKLYRINMKENMPLLFYTNSIFYDNFNRTLPEGMHLSSKVLIDLNNYTLQQIATKEFCVTDAKNEYERKVETVTVIEYEIEPKK